MGRKVKLFESDFEEVDALAVADVVRGGWLTNGEKTLNFEGEIAELLEVPSDRVAAVSSCTTALHLALVQYDVGPGDGVIVPPLTFVSDFNVIRSLGALPVFCDVESTSQWTPSVENIEPLIRSNTKALMLTHFAGLPAKHTLALRDLCHANNMALIEDCAHALGAKIGDQSCGTIGDFGAFSFYSNKNISMGEGGLLVSKRNNDTLRLRSHGMSTSTLDRDKGRAFTYDVLRPGFNYRIDEMRAQLGSCQLARFEKKHRIRRRLVDRYMELLAPLGFVSPLFIDRTSEAFRSVDHIMPILLPDGVDRASVMSQILEDGIQTSIHYPPPWSMTAYREIVAASDFPVAAAIAARELTLPLHTKMEVDDVDYVVDCLVRVLS